MTCYLPQPYPDELLYSVIARYVVHTGAHSARAAATNVFGRYTTAQVAIPFSLNEVSKRTWQAWGLSGEEIAHQLTLFPFYSRYISTDRQQECLKTLLGDNGTGVNGMLGHGNNRVMLPGFLRFCKTCRERDLESRGETYWHRSHQLQGVVVCPEHGEPLIHTTEKMIRNKVPYYVDATLITDDTDQLELPQLCDDDSIISFKIAQRCKEMLIGPIKEWEAEDILSEYRRVALQKGFGVKYSLALLSQSKLDKGFNSFYSDAFLSRIGCREGMFSSSWFLRMLCSNKSNYSNSYLPIEHALIQVFLENFTENVSDHSFGIGPWKCPNPLAAHEEAFPISRIKIRKRPNSSPVASGVCSCGYAFSFHSTSPMDSSLPVVSRVKDYGPLYQSNVRVLLDSGLSLYKIGMKLKLPTATVIRILSAKTATAHKITVNMLEKWRKEWLDILEETPGRSRYFARKKNDALFAKLYKHDKAWLLSEPAKQPGQPIPQSRTQRLKPDFEWSNLLKEAANQIREELPVRQVKINRVIQKAGLPRSLLLKPQHFPMCLQVLNEQAENLGDFYRRKLVAEVQKVKDSGKTPKASQLRRLVHKLSPELIDLIRELASG